MINAIINKDDLLQVKDGQPMADSLTVAKRFDRKHKNVLQAIQNLECSDEFARLNFQPCEYTGNTGGISRKYPMYLMTRDGFSFLAMGFTGAKAAHWKEAYIKAFNRMEAEIRGRSEPREAERKLHETERELLDIYRDHLQLIRHNKRRGSKLTPEEKQQIYILTHRGYSHHYIARKLGRDASNIRRWQKLYQEWAEVMTKKGNRNEQEVSI